MGESKRRKALDPNYGKTFNLGKALDSKQFEIVLESQVKDSWVCVRVTDTLTSQEATLPFHIFIKNNKAYAEAAILSNEIDKYQWVKDNMNTLSPKICEKIYEKARLIIVNP